MSAGLVFQHNQADFHAQAVRASAVIDQIYLSAPSQNYGAPTFDQYAIVHFPAHGKTAHARVLLVANCGGTCVSGFHVGQELVVDYSPKNLRYAQLHSRAHSASANFWYVLLIFAFMGVVFLAAAVINAMTA